MYSFHHQRYALWIPCLPPSPWGNCQSEKRLLGNVLMFDNLIFWLSERMRRMAFVHSLCMCARNISECYIHSQLKETDIFTSNHNRNATDRPDNYIYSIIIRCRRTCASIVMRSSMTLTIQGRHRPRSHGDYRDLALLYLCAASIDAEFQAVYFN